MIINIKEVTKLCVKMEITYTEFCFLFMLAIKDYGSVIAYVKAVDGFPEPMIKRLSKKGLLLNMNKVSEKDEHGNPLIKAKLLHTTPEFDDYIKDNSPQMALDGAYDELQDNFPYEFAGDDGSGGVKMFNARTANYLTYKHLYSEMLNGSIELHKEIVELTKYGKEHGLIKVGLAKYIDGRVWGKIKEAREKGIGNVSSDFE